MKSSIATILLAFCAGNAIAAPVANVDKRAPAVADRVKRSVDSALTWWANEVLDDDPLNPFDDPGLPGKRDVKSALTWWANEVLDDDPLNPFDDEGLPGKRDVKDALVWWANEVLDDDPLNPFDDPGLPGKRSA